MGYTQLKNTIKTYHYAQNSLEEAVLTFIRERCEGLRFDKEKQQKKKEPANI
ncbi:MAG: hypothetical protein IKJ01_08415 [Lachnospiraceae bacterium]|nr:hypothetical protein [Lachnospiraceae bacterium]